MEYYMPELLQTSLAASALVQHQCPWAKTPRRVLAHKASAPLSHGQLAAFPELRTPLGFLPDWEMYVKTILESAFLPLTGEFSTASQERAHATPCRWDTDLPPPTGL